MPRQVPVGQVLDDMVVYQEKRREAEAALAALASAGGEPADPAQFPLLAAELGVTAIGLQQLAEIILVKAREWTAAAAAIEGTRLRAKRDIAAATSAEEVDALIATVTWGA
jgi:hypothetical protein